MGVVYCGLYGWVGRGLVSLSTLRLGCKVGSGFGMTVSVAMSC